MAQRLTSVPVTWRAASEEFITSFIAGWNGVGAEFPGCLFEGRLAAGAGGDSVGEERAGRAVARVTLLGTRVDSAVEFLGADLPATVIDARFLPVTCHFPLLTRTMTHLRKYFLARFTRADVTVTFTLMDSTVE